MSRWQNRDSNSWGGGPGHHESRYQNQENNAAPGYERPSRYRYNDDEARKNLATELSVYENYRYRVSSPMTNVAANDSHRGYPVLAEISLPTNTHEGWEDDVPPDTTLDGRLERLKLSGSSNPPRSEPSQKLIPASQSGSEDLRWESKATSSPQVQARKGAYIPWEPVRYKKEESAVDDPVTREEMLEVLSHIRRDRDGVADRQNRGGPNQDRGHERAERPGRFHGQSDVGHEPGARMGMPRDQGWGSRGKNQGKVDGWNPQLQGGPPEGCFSGGSHGQHGQRQADTWGVADHGQQEDDDDDWGQTPAPAAPEHQSYEGWHEAQIVSSPGPTPRGIPPNAPTAVPGVHPDRLRQMRSTGPASYPRASKDNVDYRGW